VLIKDVDVERERVSLSRKLLLPNPWEQFADEHEAGDLIEGQITNLVDFGAFVQVDSGIQGLVHISEMHVSREGKPEDVLSVGDRVLLRIVNIDPEKERLGLSQRRVSSSEEIAWVYAQQNKS
jgi:ribosomal protein S1